MKLIIYGNAIQYKNKLKIFKVIKNINQDLMSDNRQSY